MTCVKHVTVYIGGFSLHIIILASVLDTLYISYDFALIK